MVLFLCCAFKCSICAKISCFSFICMGGASNVWDFFGRYVNLYDSVNIFFQILVFLVLVHYIILLVFTEVIWLNSDDWSVLYRGYSVAMSILSPIWSLPNMWSLTMLQSWKNWNGLRWDSMSSLYLFHRCHYICLEPCLMHNLCLVLPEPAREGRTYYSINNWRRIGI